MVTRGRAKHVQQASCYYQAQDDPARELIIVYEQDTDLPEPLPDDLSIRAVRIKEGTSIGQKRNEGTTLARGELVAQWDDDDWYARTRLSSQVAPLLANKVDLTGLRGALFLDVPSYTFWENSPEVHAHMFVGDVMGGTLVFHRHLWGSGAVYPPTSLREDADFLVAVMRRPGPRRGPLPARDLFIYVRHGHNTWSFTPGRMVDATGWKKVPEPPSFATDRHRDCRTPP